MQFWERLLHLSVFKSTKDMYKNEKNIKVLGLSKFKQIHISSFVPL